MAQLDIWWVYLDYSVISSPFLEIRDEHLKVVHGWVAQPEIWWVYLDYSVISGAFLEIRDVSCLGP